MALTYNLTFSQVKKLQLLKCNLWKSMGTVPTQRTVTRIE